MNTLPTLLLARFRRDRVQIIVWLALFALLEVVGHFAVTETYGDAAERASVIRLVIMSPAILMLRGTPQGTAPDAFQFFLLFGFLGLLIGLMMTFLAVRHTRGDEEAGRAELVGSTPAGRIAPLLATALEGVILSIAVGVIMGGVAWAYGADASGAVLYGAAMSAVGIAYLGVGLACAQLMRTSRGANGLAAAIVTAGYALRAMGDATGTVQPDGLSMEAGWWSRLSPIGWGQAVAPYTHQLVWPLLLSVGLGGVLFAASAWLQSHRDLDSSIVPERAGRLHAPLSLAGPIGLVWRTLRNPVIGWVVGGALFGLVLGAVGQTVVDLVNTPDGEEAGQAISDTLAALAGPNAEGGLIDLFTTGLFGLVGVLAAVGGVQAVMRARHDEAGGTAELVLAAPVSRFRWFSAYLLIGAVSVAAVLAFAVLGAFVGLIGSPDAGERMSIVAEAGLAQLPACLVIVAVAALVFAVLPRASIALGWAVLLVAIVLGQFGGLFGLPEWLRDVSPFSHTPIVTAEAIDWTAAWVMTGIAVVAAAGAAALVRRRDLARGG
ncbi:ABC transporter permease [Agromyces laixinhei]|uniref:ABC transporter permease n=1 Tax=Agromyces laixinhei TaxID=2585717 RepID=UPI0012EEDDAA|nr:polyketide antibiotic transporter [Agromyces laixinhei]